jgi:branched-chain amino acid transport system substrate-binding protein
MSKRRRLISAQSAGTAAVLPAKALREHGYRGPIFQTHGAALAEFIKLGGKDVEDTIFAGEAFTIASDLPEQSPFKKPTTEFIEKYRAANGVNPPIFGAHLFDYLILLQHAVASALKAGNPGTPAFRSAIRDELEKTKDVYLNNGVTTMSPTDHNGYDARSAFIIQVKDGAFHLVQEGAH